MVATGIRVTGETGCQVIKTNWLPWKLRGRYVIKELHGSLVTKECARVGGESPEHDGYESPVHSPDPLRLYDVTEHVGYGIVLTLRCRLVSVEDNSLYILHLLLCITRFVFEKFSLRSHRPSNYLCLQSPEHLNQF